MTVTYLNALRALEAALRLGSFTRAAEELGVTPAAVGQQIRALEARIGAELFERTRTGARPTQTTQRIRERLSFHMTGLGEVLADLRAARDESRLSLTLPASFAETWFARRMPAFWQAHPGIDLRLSAGNRMVDLTREPFDFALRFCGPQGAGLEAVELFGDYVLPVSTPGFAARFGLSEDTRSLSGVPIVHLDDRTPDVTWADWPRWADRFGVSLEGVGGELRYQEVSSGLSAARLEQGLVLAGLVEAHDALLSGELVAPLGMSRHVETRFRYRLVWSATGRSHGVRQAFADWLLREAELFRASMAQLLGREDKGTV